MRAMLAQKFKKKKKLTKSTHFWYSVLSQFLTGIQRGKKKE